MTHIVYSLIKKCFKCEADKSVTEFNINEFNCSNLDSWCKLCRKSYRSNKWKEITSDPEKHAEHNKWRREYYKQNKERIKFKSLAK